MASLLAATSRQAACLGQRAGRSSRALALRSAPKPFTAARHVQAKAQATAEPVDIDDLERDDAILDKYANLAAATEEEEDDALDLSEEDWEAALDAAQIIGTDGLDALTVAHLSAEADADVEAEDSEFAAASASKLLDARIEAGEVGAGELEELTAGLKEEDMEAVELEDMLDASNSSRFDEVAPSAAELEAMQAFKLSKPELRNLLPEDWDQINIDFFSNKKDENIPLPEFRLNVLWTEKNLAVAIDQVYSRGQTSPLTEYYFWPRQDAWEELRMTLENRPWINERDRIVLLNRLTQLINYWQDEEVKHSMDEARNEFPDCAFALI